MGTRSAIGVEFEDGSVLAVYCHWDGYPEYNGVVLQKYYNERNKVLELVNMGDMSNLGAEIGVKHPFGEGSSSQCTFYRRDRNETDNVNARTFKDRNEYFKEFETGVEYLYLFTVDNVWKVREYGRHTWKDIEKVLKVREKIND